MVRMILQNRGLCVGYYRVQVPAGGWQNKKRCGISVQKLGKNWPENTGATIGKGSGRFEKKARCGSDEQFKGSFGGRAYGYGRAGAGKNNWSGQSVDAVEFWSDLIDLQEDLVDAMAGKQRRRRNRSYKQAKKEDGTVDLLADFEDTDEQQYVIFADIPGLTKDDIKVQLGKDNELIISGERLRESTKPTERFFGKFSRTFILPQDADISTITANVENGALKITIRKFIQVEPEQDLKDIPIQ